MNAVDPKGGPAFEGWAVLELMGHRRLGGYVTEAVVAGQGLLRVEMPEDDAGPAMTQFYSPSALYCLTPTSEATARAALRLSRPEPVTKWDLQRAQELRQPKLGPGPHVEDEFPDEPEGNCGACGAAVDEDCAADCTERELASAKDSCDRCGKPIDTGPLLEQRPGYCACCGDCGELEGAPHTAECSFRKSPNDQADGHGPELGEPVA